MRRIPNGLPSARMLCGYAAMLLLALTSRRAHAAWPADPHINVPVSLASNLQSRPAAVGDGNGGAMIVWQDNRTATQVYGTRVQANGLFAPGWALDGNLISTGAAGQPRIVRLDDGRYVCAYNAGPTLQCFDSSGAVSWAPGGAVASSYHGTMDALCTDGAGGCLVDWEDPRGLPDGTFEHLFVQRYGPNGQPRWATDGVLAAVRHSATLGQAEGAICSDGAGGALVAWTGGPDTGGDIRAQKLDSLGVVQWSDSGIVVCGMPGRQSEPSIASDLQGGAYIGWTDYRSNSLGDAYILHILSDGSVAPGWAVNGRPLAADPSEFNVNVSLVPDGGGGVIAVWAFARIRMQRYSFAGDSLWGAAPVQLLLASGYSADGDGAGGAIVATVYTLSDGDIYAQRVNASGVPLWGGSNGVPVCTVAGRQSMPVITQNGSGGGIVSWVDQRNEGSSGSSGDIYAQNVNADGSLGGDVVATLLSLAGADATPKRVTVRWYTSERAISSVSVERNAGDGWVRVADVSPDGEGVLSYEDTAVSPGARYGYRARLVVGGQDQAMGETWIQVPLEPEFALRRVQPNPSNGPLSVSIALAGNGTAVLELLDISGRIIATRSVGQLGPGSHVVTLAGEHGALRPGVYAVRLRTAERSVSTRAIVVR